MSLYNADELEPPAWVNKEFFKKVLQNCEEIDNVEIITHEVTPASMKGDHYASIMLRCKVKYRLNDNANTLEKSLIIKTIPDDDGKKREMLMDLSLFETEIKMFTETLPKMEKILADCGEPSKLAARIYYHSLDPHKVVVLEDLCQAGYEVVRGRPLTADEVKGVYTKIAQLHAVSFMLGHSEQHEVVTKYQDGIFSKSFPLVDDMLTNGIRNFINSMAEHEDLKLYGQKVKILQASIHKACRDLYNAYTLNQGKGDIFVLNHGDFHMKNLMFKFNAKNKMEDIVMVDYQLSCYAPSTIDVTYSHYLILPEDLRMKRHDFTKFYFSEFLRILKKIKCPGELPKYEELQEANLKYRRFAIFLVAAFLPLVCDMWCKTLDDLKDTDMIKLVESPEIIADTSRTPRYLEDLRNYLPILLKEGYFEE